MQSYREPVGITWSIQTIKNYITHANRMLREHYLSCSHRIGFIYVDFSGKPEQNTYTYCD